LLKTKRLVAAAKFLAEATKNPFVVPDFVAVTKPFFPCRPSTAEVIAHVPCASRRRGFSQLDRNRTFKL